MTAAAPTTALTVGQLADRIDGLAGGALAARIRGDSAAVIRAVAPLDAAGDGDLAFLANVRYRQQALLSRASALVLSEADAQALFAEGRERGAVIACVNPYAWFSFASQVLNPVPAHRPGIDGTARLGDGVRIAPSARIDAYAVVDARAVIGSDVWIGAGCHVGAD
nr:UDP-3-O-(3-hydroxymyristoyl)glucosamine N-acyltransferase [Burkholderiaceae bacterium]